MSSQTRWGACSAAGSAARLDVRLRTAYRDGWPRSTIGTHDATNDLAGRPPIGHEATCDYVVRCLVVVRCPLNGSY